MAFLGGGGLALLFDRHVGRERGKARRTEDAEESGDPVRVSGPGWRAHAASLEGLARLLAETLVELDPGQEALERAGRAWGARRDGDVVAGLERLGFAARRDGDTLVLAACPCPLVAPDQPDAVCRLARAVAEGYGVRIAEAHHDARRRHCRLELYSAASSHQ